MLSCCSPFPSLFHQEKKKEHLHKHLCLIICCLDALQSPDALESLYHSALCYIAEKKNSLQTVAACQRQLLVTTGASLVVRLWCELGSGGTQVGTVEHTHTVRFVGLHIVVASSSENLLLLIKCCGLRVSKNKN